MHTAIRAFVITMIAAAVVPGVVLAQTVSVKDGNLFFNAKDGSTSQITSTGLDSDPSLSPDKKFVVFVRRTPLHKINTAIGPVDGNELWIKDTSSKSEAQQILVGWEAGVDGIPFAGFHEPRFSLDAGRIYFVQEIGWPCHDVLMLELKSGEIRDLGKGMAVEVMESGEYAGYLLVLRCSCRVWPEYSLRYWLLDSTGGDVRGLQGTEFDRKYFERSTRVEPELWMPVNPAIISGLVRDPSGVQVTNATVKLRPVESTGTAATAQTDQNGRYTFSVKPGGYDLRFEKLGFVPKTVRVKGELGIPVDVSVVLEVGSLVDPIDTTPTPLLPEDSKPVYSTLCEIMKEPQRFNGKMVRFRATVSTGPESIVLKDDGCSDSIWLSVGEKPASGKLEYAYISSIADIRAPERLDWKPLSLPHPVVLKQDKAYRRLDKYVGKQFKPKDRHEICVHCPLYVVTATVTGRFDHTDRKWRMVRGHDADRVPSSMGFGHMNSWDSQLVLQSVSDVIAKPIDPSVYEKSKR